MSMRIKAALVIMSIVLVITAAGFITNLFLLSHSISDSVNQDLSLAIDIADSLVSTKIRLIKADGAIIAERLLKAGGAKEMSKILETGINKFPEFKALSVFNKKHGIIANYGAHIKSPEMLAQSQYVQMAYNGESVISTTLYDTDTNDFIMYVFVPMTSDMTMVATISGLAFSDFIRSYKLWKSGNIYILDEDGTIIAHNIDEFVLQRLNPINEAKSNPYTKDKEILSRKEILKQILSTKKGSGTFLYDKIKFICKYKRVTGETTGWYVLVAAPENESPAYKVRMDLIFSSIIFLTMGLLVSIFASPIVIKPFIKIKEQNHVLETLNKAAQEQSDEIHAGAAKLEEALNETQKASNAKSDFLANMSHEMRTPLNAIIGLSELSLSELSIDTIDTGKANKEILSNLEKIYEAGETLLSTVNDILDISKIEAGKLELVPNKYSIPSLINDTITQNILRINEKPIKFILDIDASMPTYLYGDELRIKQIFNNLLSNAFKYTKKGQVELRVNCEREGEAVWITVRVEDTGIGIRPKDIENLFTDYSQMDIKNNYKIEGTGLGLSITKKIAEMMEGFVTVESQYGKGSVFTAKIKQKFVDDSTIGEEVVNNLKNFRYSEHKRKKNSMIARKRMPYAKVLVVDDVITNLDVAKGMLKPYGMQIDCVTSGQEAVDAIRNKKVKYNAVFMDHMMPEMDGLEATKIIREEIGTEYARTVPIIALTANAIIGNEEMFLENGFQAFISKPIDVQQLDTILNTWIVSKQSKKTLLKAKKESAALYAKTVKAKQQGKLNILKDVFIEGVDIDEAMKRYNNDEIAYLNILRSYCLHTPAILKKIRGLSGNTSASSKASALSEYKIALHGLKGASYSICANIIGIEAGKLEIAAKENNNKNNFALLMTKNDSFITKVETLLYNLDKLLKKTAAGKKKKQKYHAPDSRLLSKLLDASKLYKTSTMEQIMRQLESYKYKTGNELISWLRNKMDNLNYDAIQTRLNKEINKQTNKEVKNVKKEKNHFGNRRQHIYSNHDTFNS